MCTFVLLLKGLLMKEKEKGRERKEKGEKGCNGIDVQSRNTSGDVPLFLFACSMCDNRSPITLPSSAALWVKVNLTQTHFGLSRLFSFSSPLHCLLLLMLSHRFYYFYYCKAVLLYACLAFASFCLFSLPFRLFFIHRFISNIIRSSLHDLI